MMAGRPQATRWNHWDWPSMASWPHFREADRNQQAVSITHLDTPTFSISRDRYSKGMLKK